MNDDRVSNILSFVMVISLQEQKYASNTYIYQYKHNTIQVTSFGLLLAIIRPSL